MGGTMRLGVYPCKLEDGSLAARLYAPQTEIEERHRHRFEFNNLYRGQFEQHGMIFSGVSPDGNLMEIAELSKHPFMIGSQFHPEFLSRPNQPHPLFRGLIEAAVAFNKVEAEQQSNGHRPMEAPSENQSEPR
jgi:CTP synthase